MAKYPDPIPRGAACIKTESLERIVYLLNASALILTPKEHRPILTKFQTKDHHQINFDLNICRPTLRSYKKWVPKEKQQENVEDLVIVWLDQNINHVDENISQRKNYLYQIINSLETFDNVAECLRYINGIKEEKIFLIISGSLGKTAIHEFNDCSQLLSIYIYCYDKHEHEMWSKTQSKIRGIFTVEHELITQITKDVSLFFENDLSISVINSVDTSERSTQNLTNSQAKFMWSQILIEILLRFPQTSRSKDEFIQECRRHYHNNKYQQKEINKFEKNYTPTNALSWYTKNAFPYRILNKALRTQNILYIYKCRFFIIDVYQQLKRAYRKFHHTSKKKILIVYRGQLMPAEELIQLKNSINGFISINTFFSTSHSSTVPFKFTGEGSGRPMFESVYFEIELNTDINQPGFVNMNDFSNFKSENELLLCLGTVFRIETVEPMNEFLWYVKLVSANEEEITKLNNLKQYVMRDIGNISNYLALGKILHYMGEYDRGKTYYEFLLTELPSHHPNIPEVYSALGTIIMSMQTDSKLALKYLKQSLALQLERLPNNLIQVIGTLHSIASVYVENRKFKLGLVLFRLLLEILDCMHVGETDIQIIKKRADVLNNIAYIYSKTGLTILSLKFYKKTLALERKILPSNHPNVAVSLNNIGVTYLKIFNYELAEKYLLEANKIRQESLPFEYHPDLAQMYNNIGVAQYYRENFDQALFHFEKALEIQLKCLPPIHPNIAMLYSSIGNIYSEKNVYQKALEMYEKSVKIGEQCWLPFDPELGKAYGNIGSTYRYLGNYDRALYNCEKSLHILLKSLSPTDPDLAEAYQNVGSIYHDMNNHEMALINFQKALDIYIKKPPFNLLILGMLYDKLAMEYYDVKNYLEALKYFQNALAIYETNKEEESSLAIVYYNLGNTFCHTGDYKNALLYLNKCLHTEMTTTLKCNFQSLSKTYHSIGETYEKMKDYQQSLENYSKALETVLKDDSSSQTNDKSSLIEDYRKNIQQIKSML